MKSKNSFADNPHFCLGYQGIEMVRIDPLLALPCPLQLRKLEHSNVIEATLGGETVVLTGAKLEEFWRMVEQLR